MEKLTKRQAEILKYIKKSQALNGYPPTRVEIARDFGFASPNAAEEHIKALVRKGALFSEPGIARGLRVA